MATLRRSRCAQLLIRRNNGAVAEAKALMELFGERVAPVEELYLAEFVATGALECISNARLESTVVVDDLAVLFIERAGRTYLNVLEKTCADLARYGRFQVSRDVVAATTPQMGAVQTNRLCTRDFIVPYMFETRVSDSRPCPLGWFFEVSPEQVDRIMQLRPVRPEDGAEQAETPAPPSSAP